MRSDPKTQLAALLCACAIMGGAPRANAYRTSADDPGLGGAPAVWRTHPPFLLADTSFQGVSQADATRLASNSMQRWIAPSCSALGANISSATSAPTVPGDGSSDIVALAAGWEAMGLSADMVATTDIQYERNADGAWEIVEADILVNDQYYDFAEGEVDGRKDLNAVLTHEFGHAFGLLHPCEELSGPGVPACGATELVSTMYPGYQGSEQASLETDDIAGICALYPGPPCEVTGCVAPELCTSLGCANPCAVVDCGPDAICNAGVCVPTTCSDCDAGAGSALAQLADPCAAPVQCASSRCLDGFCAPACATDADCSGGACIATGAGDACRLSTSALGSPCAEPRECTGNICVVSSIHNEYCSRECRADAPCPGGYSCLTVESIPVCARVTMAESSGCSIAFAQTGGPQSPAMLFGVLAALLLASRRRRARMSPVKWRLGYVAGAVSLLSACGGTPAVVVDAATPTEDTGTADAGPGDDAGPQPCSTVGAMEVVACGNCGIAQRLCSGDGFWETGACLSQGECAPADVETERTPQCGERTRICDTACHFRPWEVTQADGVCAAGEERPIPPPPGCSAGEVGIERCATDCTWVLTTCAEGCSNDARVTPLDEAEVCVPAGPFMRGTDSPPPFSTNDFPMAEVRLSSFYIDRFPVTNARYARCVDAGACAPPHDPTGIDYFGFRLPENSRRPVQSVLYADAVAFCSWDGRRLATSAEWEKAVRGPSPRDDAYLWGGTDYQCDRLESISCPGYSSPAAAGDTRIYDDVDALPGTRSYYGTEMQIGGGLELVSDLYAGDYYTRPESRVDDPQGPTTGVDRTIRGAMRNSSVDWHFSVWVRRVASSMDGRGDMNTIRCARSATASAP